MTPDAAPDAGPEATPDAGPGTSAGEPLDAVLRAAVVRLRDAGIQTARADVHRLAGHVLATGPSEVATAALTGRRLAPQDAERFGHLLAQRADRVPLQHLTGRAPFRTVELDVGPGVFVPRPETETVAGLAIQACRSAAAERAAGAGSGDGPVVAVDLCTGSGAIALSLAFELPGTRVVALELDPAAFAWAGRNVGRIAPGAVDLRLGDVADVAVLADLAGAVDVVVANPPYIPDGARPVDPEVADHDPPAALFGGGEDGLVVPAAVVAAAARLLRPGGWLIMEHGDLQGAATRALVPARAGWTDVRTFPDLTRRDRTLVARRTPAT